MVPVKVKITSTNKSEKANDSGGHETRTIECVQVDEEAYNSGGPVDDTLCSEGMHNMARFRREEGEWEMLERGGKWGMSGIQGIGTSTRSQ